MNRFKIDAVYTVVCVYDRWIDSDKHKKKTDVYMCVHWSISVTWKGIFFLSKWIQGETVDMIFCSEV
jgi:hypothetical protein